MEDRYGVRGQEDHGRDHQGPLGRSFSPAHQYCSFTGCCRHACLPTGRAIVQERHYECAGAADAAAVLAGSSRTQTFRVRYRAS